MMRLTGSQLKKKPIAEINIVPYVDVMLVLLVIFMITAPLLTQGVHIDLPQGEAEPLSTEQPLPVVVSVNEQGELFLNISDNPKLPLMPNDLYIEVAAALKRNPDRAVLIRGDKRVAYDTVLSAMVILQQAGVPSVGLEMSPIEVSETS